MSARFRGVQGPRPTPLPPYGTEDVFTGTGADETFNGTTGDDTFNMASGGNDTVSGKGGADTFNFGAQLTAADAIDGGTGADRVILKGNYVGAGALVFAATTMTNVETLTLSTGSFDIKMNNASVLAGDTLTVDAAALGAGRTFTFDGSAETNGHYDILAGAAQSFITGGGEDDTFHFGANLDAGDRIDGGGGDGFSDTLILDGDYSAGVVFAPNTIRNVDVLRLAGGHDYFLTLDNSNIVGLISFEMDGSALGAGDSLIFDGSDETSSSFSISGGAGNDQLLGGASHDFFDPGAGSDKVFGGAGDDQTLFFGTLNAADRIDGGDGDDAVTLSGGGTLTFSATTIHDVETLAISGGDFVVTLNPANVPVGRTLIVDGRGLDATESADINASGVEGSLVLRGGDGADSLTFGKSGFDVIRGGDGDDTVSALGNLIETVRIDGGAGDHDRLSLDGNYADRLDFQGRTVRNIEHIGFAPGHKYNLALADGNVAAGALMFMDGDGLLAGDRLIFDGSKETNGRFIVAGGAGDDRILLGTGGDDVETGDGDNFVDATKGGTDIVVCGDGDDIVDFGATYDNLDIAVPGGGDDTLRLNGDYGGTTFEIAPFERVELAAGHSYHLASELNGGLMFVLGGHLGTGETLTFDGSGGGQFFFLVGGAGSDFLTGGDSPDSLVGNASNDVLTGAAGADSLFGGGGADIFAYTVAAESSGGTHHDTLAGINFFEDKIRLPVAADVTGIDAAVTTGNLSAATFDSDLGAAMSGHLLAHHAIVFNPSGGNLNALIFLIVDMNGVAGYQLDGDLVLDVTGGTGVLDTGDFI